MPVTLGVFLFYLGSAGRRYGSAKRPNDSPGDRQLNVSSIKPIERHTNRLAAVRDLALADSPVSQIANILSDTLNALECDHVELGKEVDGVFKSTCVARSAAARRHGSLQGLVLNKQLSNGKPFMVFDVREGPWASRFARSMDIASLLLSPLQVGSHRWTLAFGWRSQRQTFVSEDEMTYLKFLADVISRLLDLAEKQRELSDKVLTDALTGLHNRAGTLEQLADAVSAADRSGRDVAMFYVDLDGFKALNDNRGHSFGDAVLARVAERMRAVLRRHEIAGRIGGDEFAIIISSFRSRTELQEIAKRLLAAISEPLVHEGVEERLSASIGIALYPRDAQSAEDLLGHADSAMYQAKRRPGSGYAFYGVANDAGRLTIAPPAASGSTGLEQQLMLCFQPIVSVGTGKIVAAEALLRWLHPSFGMLLPGAFLDILKRDRHMGRADRWVVDTIAAKAAEFKMPYGHLDIHVNVSEPDESVLRAVHDVALPISIEVTEDVIATDPQRYLRFFEAARERGFKVGLANFGAGGLSLRDVAELPLNFVKIGRGLSSSIPGTRAAVEQAHCLGWSVIAQDVESERERERLSAQGVDAVQGYCVGGPLAASDFVNWLRYKTAS